MTLVLFFLFGLLLLGCVQTQEDSKSLADSKPAADRTQNVESADFQTKCIIVGNDGTNVVLSKGPRLVSTKSYFPGDNVREKVTSAAITKNGKYYLSLLPFDNSKTETDESFGCDWQVSTSEDSSPGIDFVGTGTRNGRELTCTAEEISDSEFATPGTICTEDEFGKRMQEFYEKNT